MVPSNVGPMPCARESSCDHGTPLPLQCAPQDISSRGRSLGLNPALNSSLSCTLHEASSNGAHPRPPPPLPAADGGRFRPRDAAVAPALAGPAAVQGLALPVSSPHAAHPQASADSRGPGGCRCRHECSAIPVAQPQPFRQPLSFPLPVAPPEPWLLPPGLLADGNVRACDPGRVSREQVSPPLLALWSLQLSLSRRWLAKHAVAVPYGQRRMPPRPAPPPATGWRAPPLLAAAPTTPPAAAPSPPTAAGSRPPSSLSAGAR